MIFDGRFKDHILPDKIHMLNVSFLVPRLRREFGGCAGNIAYNLRLLGDTGYPMATVGRDFAAYEQWMRETDVPQDYVRVVETEHTAQAFITTDLDDNQITAFHPGAMQLSHLNAIPKNGGITLGIVGPDGRDGMVQHCTGFAAAGIPFIFDPGQGLPMFNGDDLRAMIGKAAWVTVNDYEWQVVQQRTGWNRGRCGETCQSADRDPPAATVRRSIPRARKSRFRPPKPAPWWIRPAAATRTAPGCCMGCSTASIGPPTGRIASLLGALKIASRGPQNHRFTVAELATHYRDAFGTDLPR